MVIKTVVVGPLQVNCFIIADEETRKALVVDPGDEPDRIMDLIRQQGLDLQYIVCTHGHFDHVGAVIDMKQETGARVVLHKDDLEIYAAAKEMGALWGFAAETQPEPDLFVRDGDTIAVGNLQFRVFHTPGHSPGGICLYSEGVAVTGDTLFAGSIGRTDFHGGDINRLKQSFRRLMELPDSTKVLPGHGPSSTIGRERSHNMFSEEFLK
ncbi:MAG: MBL fold metallo-hydrolase [Nitrospirota bacterium]